MPTSPDESATAAAKTAARKRATTAAAKDTNLRTRAETLDDELAALREAEHAAGPARAARAEDLARLLGRFDLAWDDADILASQHRAVAETQQREEEACQIEISTSVTAKTTAGGPGCPAYSGGEDTGRTWCRRGETPERLDAVARRPRGLAPRR